MSHEGSGGTGRRIKTFLATVIVIVLGFAFVTFMKYQYDGLTEVEHGITLINREIEEQNQLTESLELERSGQGSDEFYEKVAREVFKLVYPNEVIFKKR